MFKSFFKSQPVKTSTGKSAMLTSATQKSLAITKMRQEFIAYQTKRLVDQSAVSKAKIGETMNTEVNSGANWTTPADMRTGLNRGSALPSLKHPCIYANGFVCEGRTLAG